LRDARPLAVKAHGLSEELGRLLASLVQGAGGRFVRQVSADGASDMWVSASESGLRQALAALHAEGSAGAVALADELHAALTRAQRQVSPSCRIGSREFVWAERTHVMGIVNVTPDSFSGDGLLAAATDVTERDVERAVGLALQMLSDGADLIDVGGESTRPGASSLTAAQELARVLPVIQRLARETDAPISVDTYRASVAAAALQAGAGLVNDVWGLRMDPDMGPVVAAHGAPIVIMHNRSKPRNAAQEERLGGRYVGVHYDNLIADVLRELRGQVGQALACGIREDGIIIDPGIGFGKTVEQNLALLDQIGELRVLGYPILLGPSRKSFIGYTLDLPPEERLEGTLATVVAGVLRGGAQIVRVHDVRATVRAVRMADAIRAAGKAL
jgi:dihydropteroate synthase